MKLFSPIVKQLLSITSMVLMAPQVYAESVVYPVSFGQPKQAEPQSNNSPVSEPEDSADAKDVADTEFDQLQTQINSQSAASSYKPVKGDSKLKPTEVSSAPAKVLTKNPSPTPSVAITHEPPVAGVQVNTSNFATTSVESSAIPVKSTLGLVNVSSNINGLATTQPDFTMVKVESSSESTSQSLSTARKSPVLVSSAFKLGASGYDVDQHLSKSDGAVLLAASPSLTATSVLGTASYASKTYSASSFNKNPNMSSRDTPIAQARFASTTGAVSLMDAVRLAVNWHPTIRRFRSEFAQNKESIKEAKAGYYPTLDLKVRSGIQENEYTGERDKRNRVELSANQTLYDFGKTSNRVKLSEASTDRSSFMVDKSLSDISYETINAYLYVVRYKKIVEIAKNQVKGFRDINEIAKLRAERGASARSDYSQSKVRLASSESTLFEYEAQLQRWSSVLNTLVNRDIASKVDDNVFQSFQTESSCGRVDKKKLENAPNVAVAKAQIAMAKAQLEQSKSEYYPTIGVGPTYEYRVGENNSGFYPNSKKGNFGVFLNLSMPLYSGGVLTAKKNQAKAAMDAAEFNLDSEKVNAEQKIIEASSQIESTLHSLGAKKARESEAIETRDLYKLQFIELGTRSFTDLLSAEAEIHQTGMDIVNGEHSIATYVVECLYQSGQLLDDVNTLAIKQ